ncbi:MAG: flagellar basal body protein FliL [Alphaproteobacteria bacterium]|nr:MAG: flagellar basal body protein FliL [Alphaproteobacteria bacterium]
MADAVAEEAEVPPAPKAGGKGLIIGLALALVLGGAGFYAGWSGLVPLPFGPAAEAPGHEKPKLKPLGKLAFLPLGEVVITLGTRAHARVLKVNAELEIAPEYEADVILLRPRILDVVNTYLRAVEVADLENPAAMPRLRAQLLRRVQVVAGEGRVRDFLITEFVLN